MIKKIFAVYDTKAQLYNAPFMLNTKGEAIRGFSDIAKDDNSQIGRHPEDYVLFELGEWNDLNAQYNLYDAPQSVVVAIELLELKTPTAVNE